MSCETKRWRALRTFSHKRPPACLRCNVVAAGEAAIFVPEPPTGADFGVKLAEQAGTCAAVQCGTHFLTIVASHGYHGRPAFATVMYSAHGGGGGVLGVDGDALWPPRADS